MEWLLKLNKSKKLPLKKKILKLWEIKEKKMHKSKLKNLIRNF